MEFLVWQWISSACDLRFLTVWPAADQLSCLRRDCTRFACRIFSQDSLTEMVSDMGRAVYELLTLYGNTNKALPDTLIMFR